MNNTFRSAFAALTISVVAVLAACAPAQDDAAIPSPVATTPATAPATDPSVAASSSPEAERDAFLLAQGVVLDGTMPQARTEPQIAFIAAERAHVEAQGLAWTAQDEGIALALAVDACETSILGGHALADADFDRHAATSPLIATLVAGLADAERAAAEQNLVELAVFGTGYLCPADAPWWQDRYDTVYP